MTITICIDADACPIDQEVYRVAERNLLKCPALKIFQQPDCGPT